jgi:argininosuccinate synthase
MKEVKKVVLAYSGGLDTSIIVPWLKENYKCEVIACVVNIGQEGDFEKIRIKAIKSGADKVYIIDKKNEFVEDYIIPMIKSGAIYEEKYLMGTSIARPLIAKTQLEVAKKERADAVAHGATGKGNDQVRFELTYKALAPDIKIIAPWREWDIRSRTQAMEYAAKHNIPVTATRKKPYSEDDNIFHISHEGGILEDPENEPPEDIRSKINPVEKTPKKPQYVSIGFEKGVPVSYNQEKTTPLNILEKLNKIGSLHGIGFVDMVENRLVGIKSRGVYETPGGTLLYIAHRELEEITLDRETKHFKYIIANKMAELIYYGMWFSPLREALSAFVEKTQENVTGEVKLKLFKGNVFPASKSSPYSLYQLSYATFEEEDVYSQKDAEGFINLYGLQLKILNKIKKKNDR